MTNTVPTPTTPDQPTEKRADQLEPGDWFTVPQIGDAAEALSVHPGVDTVLVVYRAADPGAPEVARIRTDRTVRLLTPAEIESEKEAGIRLQIGEDLRRFATMLLDVDALFPKTEMGGVDFQLHLDDLDQVTAVSTALGIPVEVDAAGRHSVFWPKGRKSYERGVHVEWFVYVEKEPKPTPVAEALPQEAPAATDTGLDFSREPDAPTATPVPNGVEGRPVGKRTPAKAARP